MQDRGVRMYKITKRNTRDKGVLGSKRVDIYTPFQGGKQTLSDRMTQPLLGCVTICQIIHAVPAKNNGHVRCATCSLRLVVPTVWIAFFMVILALTAVP